MEVIYPRCAGLDVHKESVVACVRHVVAGKITHEVKTFGTTTAGLLDLSAWLAEQGVTHVAMAATGVYWKPVWHVLEGRFELLLVNPAHARNVPGRKSDVSDAHWLADLVAHGLIRASFVPPQPIQELRDLTRTRKQLVRQVARHTLRIQKTLEDANLKAFALGLAEALVAIHEAGVTHRDLKAENVILSDAGPKVVDFGIARHPDLSQVTASQVVLGTPGWLAPERLQGIEASPASDVFSWGLLVAYAASGVPARLEDNPQLTLTLLRLAFSGMFFVGTAWLMGRFKAPHRYVSVPATVTTVEEVNYLGAKRWKVRFAYFDQKGNAQESAAEVSQPGWRPGDACEAIYRQDTPDLATLTGVRA